MINYMYSRVADLYLTLFGFRSMPIARSNVLKYVVVERHPTPLAKAIYLLNSIIEQRITERLSRIVREAERLYLFERFHTLEASWEVRGSIIWSLSVQNASRLEPPLQQVIVRDPRSPENLLLAVAIRLAEELLARAKEMLSEVTNVIRDMSRVHFAIGSRTILLQSIMEDLTANIDSLFNELRLLRRRPLLRYLRVPKTRLDKFARSLRLELRKRAWVPKWVKELLNVIDTMRSVLIELEELRTVILHRIRYEARLFNVVLKYWAWRLYELYVMLLILEVLKNLGAEIVGKDLRNVVVIVKNSVFSVSLSTQLDNSKIAKANAYWIENGEIPRDLLLKCRGRPDIAITSTRPLAIIEAKFSRNPSYLSAARFKIMAYAYEYEPYVAILAYPGVSSKALPLDEEDLETVKLLKEAETKNGIVLDLRNGSKLCIVPIVPSKRYEPKALLTLKKVLSIALQHFLIDNH